ncbi:hypothetical protein [Kushneria aurantia]|uniref:DNA-binding protein n=1 Tax=Kushneria aurantia TaxID=504092 RepID=A0ABV6G4G6_9GAMM|nr:hypothetical protein [Kushneria aurantia]
MGKLIRLDEWKARRFEGQGPSDSLLRKLCRNGDLPAKKIGASWYVDIDAEQNQTGNDLADQVLASMKKGA